MKFSGFVWKLSTVMALLIVSDAAAASRPHAVVNGPNSAATIVAERRDPIETETAPQPPEYDSSTGLPIVDADSWLTETDLPWSQLILIRDENHHSALAVLDREYEEGFAADFRNPGVISQWQRHHLEVYGYGLIQTCLWGVICDVEHPIYPVSGVSLKIGEQIFDLQPRKHTYTISEEVAWALKNAPVDEVWIRVAIAGGSNFTTRAIGTETIQAWRELYQDVEQTEVAALSDLSTARVATAAADLPTDLPVVEEARWRFQEDVPCSELVVVQDTFEGDYLAVLDRAYSIDSWSGTSEGILTNWSRDRLAIHLFEAGPSSYSAWAVDHITLDLDGQTFVLTGTNNTFAIEAELYNMLGGQLQSPPTITYFDQEGDRVTQEIGAETVEVWQRIYAPVTP